MLLDEPEASSLLDRIVTASTISIGTPTVAETLLVLARRLDRDPSSLLAGFLREAAVTEVPFGTEHARAALSAWLRFGKGRHPAALNLGDCFAYAVAHVTGEPLLCVGEDFPRTDLPIA